MHYPDYELQIYDIYKPLIEGKVCWVTVVEPFTVRAKVSTITPVVLWTSSMGYYRRWLVNLIYRRKGIKYESVGIPYYIPGEDEIREFCLRRNKIKDKNVPEHFNNAGFGFVEFVTFDMNLVKQEVVESKLVFNQIPPI